MRPYSHRRLATVLLAAAGLLVATLGLAAHHPSAAQSDATTADPAAAPQTILRFVDASSGDPVHGVAVAKRGEDPMPADDAGMISIATPGEDRVSFIVTPPTPYAPFVVEARSEYTAAGDPLPIVLPLERAGAIRLRFVDRNGEPVRERNQMDNGMPIPTFQRVPRLARMSGIDQRDPLGDAYQQMTEAGASDPGVYTATGLLPGQYGITRFPSTHVAATLRAGETLDLGDITVAPWQPLTLALRDANGNPRRAVDLQVRFTYDSSTSYLSGRTDRGGVVRVENRLSAGAREIAVAINGRVTEVPLPPSAVEAWNAGEQGIDEPIQVAVTDEPVSRTIRFEGYEGRPMTELNVEALVPDGLFGRNETGPIEQTGPGEWTVGPVRPGVLSVRARLGDADVVRTLTFAGPDPNGDPTEPLVVRLPESRIGGRLVSASGTPVANATVTIGDRPAVTTDGDGRFVLFATAGVDEVTAARRAGWSWDWGTTPINRNGWLRIGLSDAEGIADDAPIEHHARVTIPPAGESTDDVEIKLPAEGTVDADAPTGGLSLAIDTSAVPWLAGDAGVGSELDIRIVGVDHSAWQYRHVELPAAGTPVRLNAIPAGTYEYRVRASYAMSGRARFTVSDGETAEVAVALHPLNRGVIRPASDDAWFASIKVFTREVAAEGSEPGEWEGPAWGNPSDGYSPARMSAGRTYEVLAIGADGTTYRGTATGSWQPTVTPLPVAAE